VQRVGFIGLGAMGMPMARNVVRAGFPLTVWARRPERADPILQAGAGWASSPAALAGSVDILITIVSDSPDVRALVTGPDGILTAPRPGLVVADMSTIAPAVSRQLADECAARNVAFLDAPVSGGTQGADAGTLTIMVGGDAAALEIARPVFEAMGSNIFHVGPSGTGEIIKLVNNMLVGIIAAGIAEAFTTGAKAGADVETMARVIGVSAGASWQLSQQFPLRAFSGTFHPGFMTDLLVKDLGLGLELGAEQQSPLLLTALARQLYGAAQARGFGPDDYTSILRVIEDLAGVEVRAPGV